MGGDPITGCKGPECTTNDDCPLDKSCLGYKCNDPCPGSCGVGALCNVENHHPVCTCNHGLTGNPFYRCYPISKFIIVVLLLQYMTWDCFSTFRFRPCSYWKSMST